MCGIAGILTKPGAVVPATWLEQITGAILHRGPDAGGYFRDESAGVHLGHRRLSIIDLSSNGAQPMASHSGRYVVVLNGEIYNYRSLRREIDGQHHRNWRGTSDTEVFLAAIEIWGLDTTLAKAEGMFAFALWDCEQHVLTLARDRFGEKPLYVGQVASGLVFASQLKAIMRCPGFSGINNDDAVDSFLLLSYIPEPLTPFKNVWKVPPGCYVQLRPGMRTISPVAYWDACAVAVNARQLARSEPKSRSDTVCLIQDRLQTVVGRQMVADVPLGAFLSGGIDSSLVVALMQSQSTRPIKTFTIGFEERAYNEATHARAIAAHLGTDHTEVVLSWSEALSFIERLPDIYDEPFADSSQLPTYLVSKIARTSVTVSLSGDGGDEIFGGYNRHLWAMRYQRTIDKMPEGVRKPLGFVISTAAQPRFSTILGAIYSVLGHSTRLPSEKLNKIAQALLTDDTFSLYLGLIRRDEGLIDAKSLRAGLAEKYAAVSEGGLTLSEIMMLLDTLTYLPGDILAKVDRASMAVSLETRVPFLDHRLFEMAWQLPISSKLEMGQSKKVLRDILAKHVPVSLFERPKAGFGVPIDRWLRGPLHGWAIELLDEFQRSSSPHQAYAVTHARAEFTSGRGHLHHFLWNAVMLQAWKQLHLCDAVAGAA